LRAACAREIRDPPDHAEADRPLHFAGVLNGRRSAGPFHLDRLDLGATAKDAREKIICRVIDHLVTRGDLAHHDLGCVVHGFAGMRQLFVPIGIARGQGARR
jgi:hypothetical protein